MVRNLFHDLLGGDSAEMDSFPESYGRKATEMHWRINPGEFRGRLLRQPTNLRSSAAIKFSDKHRSHFCEECWPDASVLKN